MTTLYLIRHAQAEGNLTRRFHGHTDGKLTPAGQAQLVRLAERFKDIPLDAVYSSDLSRAKDTALAVSKVWGLPVFLTPRLREIKPGIWEDVPYAELREKYPQELARFEAGDLSLRPGGGESLAEVAERMSSIINEIVAAHPNETVAVVSHSCALRSYLTAAVDDNVYGPNTCVSCIIFEENGDLRPVFLRDTSHLEDGNGQH